MNTFPRPQTNTSVLRYFFAYLAKAFLTFILLTATFNLINKGFNLPLTILICFGVAWLPLSLKWLCVAVGITMIAAFGAILGVLAVELYLALLTLIILFLIVASWLDLPTLISMRRQHLILKELRRVNRR